MPVNEAPQCFRAARQRVPVRDLTNGFGACAPPLPEFVFEIEDFEREPVQVDLVRAGRSTSPVPPLLAQLRDDLVGAHHLPEPSLRTFAGFFVAAA